MFFRLFKRKEIPLWKKYADSILVAIGLILIWKGVWNIADQAFSFIGNHLIENIVAFIIGTLLLILNDRFLEQFIDD